MTTFVNVFLIILNIVSFIVTVLFAIFGLYEQIMGATDAEKMLEKLHIPLSYRQVLIIGTVSVFIMIFTYLLRTKFFGKM